MSERNEDIDGLFFPPPTAEGTGTGLRYKGVTRIAWSTGPKRPGIVAYNMLENGALEALWNSLPDSTLGTGIATPPEGSGRGLVGKRKIRYYNSEGETKGSVWLDIEEDPEQKGGHGYLLTWKDLETEKTLFEGVGEWVENQNVLFAAWDETRKDLSLREGTGSISPRPEPKVGQVWNLLGPLVELSKLRADVHKDGWGLVTMFGTSGSLPDTPALRSMSAHLYTLKTGGSDTQSPHDEDEIYYVLEGQGWKLQYTTGSTQATKEVKPGDLIFVPKKDFHRFIPPPHGPSGYLVLLVFFAPQFTGV